MNATEGYRMDGNASGQSRIQTPRTKARVVGVATDGHRLDGNAKGVSRTNIPRTKARLVGIMGSN